MRALLSSNTEGCDSYNNGFCCEMGASQLSIGAYEIPIFSAVLSLLLLIMLFFIAVKIAVNYFHLHNSTLHDQGSDLKPNSSISQYNTFTTSIQDPLDEQIVSHDRLDSENALDYETEVSDRTSDLNIMEGFFERDSLSSAESYPILEQSARSDSLFKEYKQYEKQLSIESQFYSRSAKAKKKSRKVAMRGFHFVYLLCVAGWFLVQAVAVFSSNSSTIARIIDIVLYVGHALIGNMIIVSAFFKSDKPLYIIISFFINLLIIGAISLTAILYSTGPCSVCSFFFPAPEAVYTYLIFSFLYFLVLVACLAKIKIAPRQTVTLWILFLLVIYIFAALGAGIVHFFGESVGFCIVNAIIIVYAAFFAPLLYTTLQRDSKYLNIMETNISNNSTPLLARTREIVKRHSVSWIPFSELELGERLGIGSAGEVLKGYFLGTPVAIKHLFDNKSQAIEDFFKEVTLMSKLSHPNILLFIGVCVRDNGDRYIITEMMDRGSVFDLIHPNLSFSAIRDPEADNELTGPRIHRILLQCARGMSYLHSFRPPIVHRDLKSHNLLVDHYWNVKVADFGLSRPQSLKTMTAAGTPQWSAPEVIRQDHYSYKADVYSFGIIIYELLSNKIPYMDLSPLNAAHRVAYDGLRPNFPPYCDQNYVALAIECWDADPSTRPGFPTIVTRLEGMTPPVIPRMLRKK